jgi:hypothetical protein
MSSVPASSYAANTAVQQPKTVRQRLWFLLPAIAVGLLFGMVVFIPISVPMRVYGGLESMRLNQKNFLFFVLVWLYVAGRLIYDALGKNSMRQYWAGLFFLALVPWFALFTLFAIKELAFQP